MNKLLEELQRLYFLDGQQWHIGNHGSDGKPTYAAEGTAVPEIVARSMEGGPAVALNQVSRDGKVRAMAVIFKRGMDWEQAAKLFQGVQQDLDFPAPAVSVSGRDGYQLWFSLAEAVSVEQARTFLKALRLKYLGDVPLAGLGFRPGIGESGSAEQYLIELAPALYPETGKWSAFIDPAMGRMFIDEPGLEMGPNPDKQADILSGFESIKAGDFQRALNSLQFLLESPGNAAENPPCLGGVIANQPDTHGCPDSRLNVGGNFSDPQSFLLAVMNDPAASAGQRIEAAKALLPYFCKGRG